MMDKFTPINQYNMETFDNGLSLAEVERLALLSEECGEILQMVGKIIRHGWDSYSPSDEEKTTNRVLLERELGDLEAVLGLMDVRGDIDSERVFEAAISKLKRMTKYLHHNTTEELLEEEG